MDKENQENIIGIKHFIKEFIYFSFNILIFCEYVYQLRATIIWLYKMKEKFYYSYNFQCDSNDSGNYHLLEKGVQNFNFAALSKVEPTLNY